MKLKIILPALLCLSALSGSSQTTILTEDFTSYAGTAGTVPTGWTFSYNGAYTTTANSGTSGPNSYKFGVNGANIVTPGFTNADTVSFWVKGVGTDNISSLLVEETSNNTTWAAISTINPMPTSGTRYSFHVNNASIALRFTYSKSVGNLTFDDFLLIRNNSSPLQNAKIKVYFNHPVNTGVSTGVNAIYLNNSIDDTIVKYINVAKYSIDFAIYNYLVNAGDSMDAIATAVNAAYSRGVTIRWIHDGSSSNTGLPLLNSNIHTVPSPTTSAYNIMHNKFMIIDANSANASDAIVWTGSCNFTRQQIKDDYNNVIVLQDQPLAQAYTAEFNMMWGSTTAVPNLTNSKFGPYKTDLGLHNFTIGGTSVELYFSPSDSTNNKIETAINTANNDLHFGVYTFTDTGDANRIINKINAGVATTGIMDNNSQAFAAYASLNPVMGSNLKVYNSSYLYHNKMLIVDASNASSAPLVLTGSHNWTGSANTKNDENTLIIHDATITNLYYQEFCHNFADLGGSACTPLVSPPVASFSLSSTSTCINQTVTLTDQSSGGATSWSWSMPGGNPASSSLQDPTVSYAAAGTYTITETATNSGGSSTPVTHTISVSSCGTGIATNGISDISVYPNPSLGTFIVESKQVSISSIDIFNSIGQRLEHVEAGASKAIVDLGTLVSGYYTLKVNYQSGCAFKRLVISE